MTTQIEVLAAIKDAIRELNSAAIYITHDLAVVAQVADRIMVLRYGNMVEVGPGREIIESPKEDYTRALLSVRKGRHEKVEHPDQENVLCEVDDVTAAYGNDIVVLEDINLKLTKSKTIAVVGESGSGKSTLARAIVGLLPPRKGAIRFDGNYLPPSFKQRSKEMLRRLQLIYQMPDVALNPRQKVKDILGRPLRFYFGVAGEENTRGVRQLLEQIELSERYADRFPSELSGGEKQRVCIARALAAQPDMIICDEVTSALDQLVAEEILKLLQRLQNELGVSYLFITHDLATVKAISDEIIVMLNGRVVEHGSRDEILSPRITSTPRCCSHRCQRWIRTGSTPCSTRAPGRSYVRVPRASRPGPERLGSPSRERSKPTHLGGRPRCLPTATPSARPGSGGLTRRGHSSGE